MADSLSATCSACAYKGEALFGAFRFSFEAGFKQCIVPAIHKPTGKLESENIYDDTIKHEEYLYYTDPSMYEGDMHTGQHRPYQSFNVFLKPDQNLCPACGNFTLQFIKEMHFD